MENTIELASENTVLEHEPESTKRLAALIERLENNNISEETVEVLEKGVKEFRENFVNHKLLVNLESKALELFGRSQS